MSSAYYSTRKKRKGLPCSLLALLRKSWTKCWTSEFVKLVLSFLRNRRARLGSYFSQNQSSESVKHVQLLFLWDGRVASDTLNIFVCWPGSCMKSVGGTSLLNKVWIIVFLPLWFLKFGPSSAFCAIVFIKVLCLFTPTGAFLNQGLPKPDFTFFTATKTVHRRFSFPRVAFLRRLCGPLIDISRCSAQQIKHFRCYGSYIPRIVSWTSFGFPSLNSRYSCPVEVWQSFTSPQHISLCFLQPRNPTWIVLLNHTVFKSASAVELPKRSFSYRTWISSSLKAEEALGLLPLPFHFRSLCFDWGAFRVCLNWTSFIRQSP